MVSLSREGFDSLDPEIEGMRNGIWRERLILDRSLERGWLSEDSWHRLLSALIRDVYLREVTPWGQSGNSGNWKDAKRSIIPAFDGDGDFLDGGCANGYLLESVRGWLQAAGVNIEPYGVDIVPELIDLARVRLPEWENRFWVGNLRNWLLDRKFDFVRVGLDFAPRGRCLELLDHVLTHVALRRVIIGPRVEEVDFNRVDDFLLDNGFELAGVSCSSHPDRRMLFCTTWIDL